MSSSVVKGYAFKYSERLKNWEEQIDTGVSKNWITAAEAETFKTRLSGLKQLNQSVSDKGYAKADLDDMEKQFSQFNIDLSNALSKPKPAAPAAKSGESSSSSAPAKSATPINQPTDGAFELSPSKTRFESAIRQFERKDASKHEPVDTIFLGSSSFTYWDDLETRFQQFQPLNRGFGGSTMAEADYYLPRILGSYRPSRIVIYEGTNDVPLGHSPERIFQDFVKLVSDIRTDRPNAQVFFISMSVPPSRMQWEKVYLDANAMIREYAQRTPHLHFIDVTAAMRDAKGALRADLFGPDHLHMTVQGYDQWTPIITQALESVPVETAKGH